MVCLKQDKSFVLALVLYNKNVGLSNLLQIGYEVKQPLQVIVLEQ